MFRRHLVQALPAWFDTLPMKDWPLFLLLASQGPIGRLPDAMAAYRIHPGGLWSGMSIRRRLEANVGFLQLFVEKFAMHRPLALRRRLARHWLDLAAEQAADGAMTEAWHSLREAGLEAGWTFPALLGRRSLRQFAVHWLRHATRA